MVFLLQLILNKVLLLGSSTQTIVGRPTLPDAAVHAVVEEHVSVADLIPLCLSLSYVYAQKSALTHMLMDF